MPTPPMLQPREPGSRPTVTGPDPAASLAVLLLTVVAVALLVGGVLAVYTWEIPVGAVRPLFFSTLGVFLAALGVLVLAAAVRHLRAGLR